LYLLQKLSFVLYLTINDLSLTFAMCFVCGLVWSGWDNREGLEVRQLQNLNAKRNAGRGRQGATGGAREGNPTGKSQKNQKKLKKVCDFAKKIIVFCRGVGHRKT